MATIMTDSHFKNELLDGWAKGCAESTLSECRQNWTVIWDLDPVTIWRYLDELWRSGMAENGGQCRTDAGRLAALIRARLAGAERAREVAETWVLLDGVGSADRDVSLQMSGKIALAREILEALDGK